MTATPSYLPNTNVQPKISKEQIFLTTLVVLSLASLYFLVSQKHETVRPTQDQVMVQPRETVWDLVAEYYPPMADVSRAEDAILARNGLKSAGDLQAGHTYVLPVIRQ